MRVGAAGRYASDVPHSCPRSTSSSTGTSDQPLDDQLRILRAALPRLCILTSAAQYGYVIGEHIISAIVGRFVGTLGVNALWGGALAGALALGVMKLIRMSHSPAAATAMIALAPAIPRWEFVVLIGSAAAILVAIGLVGNKINRTEDPHYRR